MNENIKGLYYFLDEDVHGNPTIRFSSERYHTIMTMTFMSKADRRNFGVRNAEDIVKAVNSHQAMKEALENCLEVVGSWDEEPEWVTQAKQALALTNPKGDSTECV